MGNRDVKMTFKKYALENWNYDGQSALCLFDNNQPTRYPYDPDDWCRCIQVLRKMFNNNEEAKRKHILLVAEVRNSRVWKNIGDNYYELQMIFMSEWDSCSAPKTYEFMKRLEKLGEKDLS